MTLATSQPLTPKAPENAVTCGDLFDCCSCGDSDCGCAYCFDCNACDSCKNDQPAVCAYQGES